MEECIYGVDLLGDIASEDNCRFRGHCSHTGVVDSFCSNNCVLHTHLRPVNNKKMMYFDVGGYHVAKFGGWGSACKIIAHAQSHFLNSAPLTLVTILCTRRVCI